MKNVAFAAVAAMAFAGSAMADTYSNDINIDWDTGDTGLVASDIASFPAIASIDSISLDVSHTWAGDLDVFLTAPSGDIYQLFGNAGGSLDVGIAGTGFLDDVATHTFVASGAGGTYAGGIGGGTFDAFLWGAGGEAAGDWTLSVNDTAGGDGGAVGNFTINYTAVPAPGAFALLGLAGFAARRRRG